MIKFSIKKLFKSNKNESKQLYNEIKNQNQKLKELRKEYNESKHWNTEYSFLLKQTTESMKTLIWHKDKDHKYLLANPLHCESFFGLSPSIDCLEYIKGKTDKELIKECFINQNISNTLGDMCLLSDKYTASQQITSHFLEAGIIDDEEILLYLIKMPQFDKNKNFTGTIGIGWDLTDQSGNILNLLNRWKFDKSVIELYKQDCVFCYVINPKIHKCVIFNHLCGKS